MIDSNHLALKRRESFAISKLGVNPDPGTSLVVQWLMLWASNEGGLGSVPGVGIRSRMLQVRPGAAKKKKKKKILALPLSGCITLGKLFKLSERSDFYS